MGKYNNDAFSAMKGIYSLSKTLCFRAVPVGDTLKQIEANKVIKEAKEYVNYRDKVKEVGDAVIKEFINRSLRRATIKVHSDGSMDSIEEFNNVLFGEKDKFKRIKDLAAIGNKLKAQVAARFSETDAQFVANLNTDKFFKVNIAQTAMDAEHRLAVERICANTEYMSDYRKQRVSLFDPKYTGYSIPNRCIEDNLVIHLQNCKVWEKIGPIIKDEVKAVFNHLKESTCANSVDEIFTPAMFNVLLAQGDIDIYNGIIGGVSLGEKKSDMIHGINNAVQVYNSRVSKDEKIPSMSKLKKQILSDREPISWLPDVMKDDDAVTNTLASVIHNYQVLRDSVPVTKATSSPDLSLVYVSAKGLATYSNKAYGRFNTAENAVMAEIRRQHPKGPRKSPENYEKDIKRLFNKMDCFSLSFLDYCVQNYVSDTVVDSAAFLRGILKDQNEVETKISKYLKEKDKLGKNTSFHQNKEFRNAARQLLDALMDLYHAVIRYSFKELPESRDYAFYEMVEEYVSEFKTFNKAYNSIRTYVTKKPYSTKKVRLYFSNPELGKGWSMSKEYNSRLLLFKKGNDIFIGVVNRKCRNLTHNKEGELKQDVLAGDGTQIQKIEMQVIKDPSKQLNHVFFAKGWIENGPVRPTEEILAIRAKYRDTKTITVDEKNKYIDFYKAAIEKVDRWKKFGFSFRKAEDYETMNEFYADVEEQGFLMVSREVSEAKVYEAVSRGDLYLFQVMNQDMHEKHHGRDGNQTVWIREALACDPSSAVKLCGGVAFYFRQASLDRKVTHPAGVPMENKNPDNPRKTRTLSYDLIKNKRYTEDVFSVNIPVVVNYKASDKANRTELINERVNEIIKTYKEMPVLGINRGEKNLITYAVTAPDGRILEQGNFNVVNGFDFRELLARRERERRKDKQNWDNINDIKNLKSGYMSVVIGEIVKLVLKYHCVVAIEKLDADFKSGRQKFERNVYSAFESALERKLSLVTDKNSEERTATALQLASTKAKSEEVQNGIIFKTYPWMITQTDPATGFIPRLYLYHKDNASSEEKLKKFESFRYNKKDDLFELTFDYAKVSPEAETGEKKVWTVCTYGERIVNKIDLTSGLMMDEHNDLTAKMKELLDGYGIKYASGKDILKDVTEARNATFYREFFRLVNLTTTNRSWNEQLKEYRLIGCTRDKNGKFYDSRTCTEYMPRDVDVNAAWNIARRVHRIIRNIREFDPKNPPLDEKGKPFKTPNRYISQAEWLKMVTK